MKLKNIAKASLALGILTTGMITTTAQPVKAIEQSRLSVTSKDTQELKNTTVEQDIIFKMWVVIEKVIKWTLLMDHNLM